MAISTLVIGTNKEVEVKNKGKNETKDRMVILERVLCIYYLLYFQKNSADIEALLDLSSVVNAMNLAFASKLGLKTCHIDVRA